jgi:transcription elongation factor Elf1
MTKGLRACPVCNKCGSKKFSVVSKKASSIILECKKCQVRIEV